MASIAVLFDGAGLSRLGLTRAGHDCTGYELNETMAYLSNILCNKPAIIGDVRDYDYDQYDAIWASPPCKFWSDGNHFDTKDNHGIYGEKDLLLWSLDLIEKYSDKTIWVENVIPLRNRRTYAAEFKKQGYEKYLTYGNDWQWGELYNAAQFIVPPRQIRKRIIGGRYPKPETQLHFRHYYRHLLDTVSPAITATVWKDYYSDPQTVKVRRSEVIWWGRCPSVREAAWLQGIDEFPEEWWYPNRKTGYSVWRRALYQGIGDGVPVYMAKAFGEALK